MGCDTNKTTLELLIGIGYDEETAGEIIAEYGDPQGPAAQVESNDTGDGDNGSDPRH